MASASAEASSLAQQTAAFWSLPPVAGATQSFADE